MNEIEIRAAEQRRAEAQAALLRPDGNRYFSDEEHEAQERGIARQFAADMDRIEERIEEQIERSREELLAAEHADASSSLSTAELERARAMRPFVGDDLRGLSTAALVQRCRAAMAAGDRPMMYLLEHFARQRQDADLGGDIREAARELRAKLAPDREEKVAAAKAALEEAEDLTLKVQLARVGASDLGDAYLGGGGSSSYWGAAS